MGSIFLEPGHIAFCRYSGEMEKMLEEILYVPVRKGQETADQLSTLFLVQIAYHTEVIEAQDVLL